MKRALAWLRILGAVAILGVLAREVGSGAFLDGLSRISVPGVFAALLIGLATTVFSAGRWQIVATRLGLRLSLRTAVADYYRALFLNGVLPAGVLGDVHRAVRHGRDSGDVPRGVRAVVLERTAGQVALIGSAVAVVLTAPEVVPVAFRDVVTVAGVVVVLATAAALVAGRAFSGRWIHSPSKWRRGFAVTLADLRLGLFSRETWPGVSLLSVATLAGYLALFVVAARVAGVAAPVAQLLPLMVLALLAMGLPLNVGGFGPREGVCALLFGAAGLGAAQGVTVAVVYGVLTLVASLPGAGVLLVRSIAGARPAELSRESAARPTRSFHVKAPG